MADDKTITSANSVFTLTVRKLYTSPVTLQGYMADRAFETDAQDFAETVMGVDGIMSAGYTPTPTSMLIGIMPDSPSSVIFETIMQSMQSQREVFFLDATVVLPSIRRKYTLTKGVLTNAPRLPPALRVLQGRGYRINWERASGANL